MNIGTLLARSALAHPNAIAVAVGEGPAYSYGELAGAAARRAHALRTEHNLQPGDRVARAMRNCPAFLLPLFAAWYAGLSAVPINFRLHRQEFRYILDNSGARVC